MRIDLGMYVSGYTTKDEQYDKMKAVYWACRDANIDIPMEVRMYFNDEVPTDDEMRSIDLGDAITFSSEDSNPDLKTSRVAISVHELPKDVDVIIIDANAKFVD